MRKVLLNPAQNSLLVDRGYVKHRLLSETEVLRLLEMVHRYYPEVSFLPKENGRTHENITTSYLNDDIAVREEIFEVVRNVLSIHVESLLNDYRILSCGLFVKASKGGWLDLHYHPTVVDDPKHWVIDIWCPLQDTDISNGTFYAVPESHRIFPRIIDLSNQHPHFFQGYTKEIRCDYSEEISVKAGEAVLFEDSLLHWSPSNMSDFPRYAIHCTCIPREARAVYVYSAPGDPPQFEMYEVEDHFFTTRSRSPQRESLKLLKVIPDHNPSVSFEEFKARMRNSRNIRESIDHSWSSRK